MGASCLSDESSLGRPHTSKLPRDSVKSFPELAPEDVLYHTLDDGMLHARATTLSMASSASSDSMCFEIMIFKYI